MSSMLLRCAAIMLGWTLASGMGGAEVAAATKYKACTLLTAAEVEGVLKLKVTQTDEDDEVIKEGLYKGEVMSSCVWTAGSGPATVQTQLLVTRAPRTPQERAEYLKLIASTTEELKKQGWSSQSRDFGGVACAHWRPPAGTSDLPVIVYCAAEKRGLAFTLSFLGAGLQMSMEQVKSLVDKVAGRIR